MTDAEREVIAELCGYLEALLEDCVRMGIPQDLAADIQLAIANGRALLEPPDPAPYCQYCGARREQDCHCGPIAENN